jgi:hypothetical protein
VTAVWQAHETKQIQCDGSRLALANNNNGLWIYDREDNITPIHRSCRTQPDLSSHQFLARQDNG